MDTTPTTTKEEGRQQQQRWQKQTVRPKSAWANHKKFYKLPEYHKLWLVKS